MNGSNPTAETQRRDIDAVNPVASLVVLAIIALFESPIIFSKCFVCLYQSL